MCMIDACDGLETHQLSYVPRLARQAHHCSECGREIAVGERYRYERAVSDGAFWVAKTCAHCQVATAWLQKACGGFVRHGVLEDIGDHVEAARMGEELPGWWLARVYVAMRRHWQRFAGPGLLPVPELPGA